MKKYSLFTDEDKNALLTVLDSGRLHRGQQIKEFEEAFAAYFGVKHAVAVSGGTAGMHIALRAAAVGPKEEVLVPPIAPVGGPNSVFYQGGVNIFADVDPATGNVDPQDVIARINDNTKGIIVHHYAGMPCDLQPILTALEGRDIPVLVDATHALGARYLDKSAAQWGDMVVFDFGPGNHIYTGEGGMVVTQSDEYAEWLRIFRDEGFVRDPRQLTKDEGLWHVEMQDLGYPYRMTELQAALGLSQLKRLDEILTRRRTVAERYNAAFSALEDAVAVPWEAAGSVCAYGLYPLQLKAESLKSRRRQLFAALKTLGVDVDVQHYPVFLHPYYLWAGHPDVCTLEGSRAPKAEEFYARILLLPISQNLTDEQVDDIINKVKHVIKSQLDSGEI